MNKEKKIIKGSEEGDKYYGLFETLSFSIENPSPRYRKVFVMDAEV